MVKTFPEKLEKIPRPPDGSVFQLLEVREDVVPLPFGEKVAVVARVQVPSEYYEHVKDTPGLVEWINSISENAKALGLDGFAFVPPKH